MSAAANQSPSREIASWAASGAMALTGRPGRRPLGPPAPLVGRLETIAARLAEESARFGSRVPVDPLAMLTWRAAIGGLGRRGDLSCGGATRLVRSADAWIAVSLPRPDDIEVVPAWLEVASVDSHDPWSVVTAAVQGRSALDLVERARLLGLGASILGERTRRPDASTGPFARLPVAAEPARPAPPLDDLSDVRILDLSSLWAGPWCGTLLARAGATVVKVESVGRPDGARLGPPAFFDVVNAGKRGLALDLADDVGRHRLRALIERADVVIEGSRPRALRQLGIDAERMLAAPGGRLRVWASVTGHGRRGEAGRRIGFGDDAAVAGGLVVRDESGPCFCVDAIADPCAGLVASAATLAALRHGGHWLLDISLADVAAHLAGPTLAVADEVTARPPVPPAPPAPGPALGAHTDEVLAECGLTA